MTRVQRIETLISLANWFRYHGWDGYANQSIADAHRLSMEAQKAAA